MSKLALPQKGQAAAVPAIAREPESFSVKHSWLNTSNQVEDALDDLCKLMRRQTGRRITKQEVITLAVTELLRSRGLL